MSEMTSLDPSAIRPLNPAGAGSAQAPTSPEQLKALAAQFEAMLMSQMLQQMQSSMFDDKDTDTGFAKGPLADAMYSELSLALSRAGGVGVAESMMGSLLRDTQTSTVETGSIGELSPSSFSLAAPDLSGRALDPTTFGGPISSEFGWRRDPLNGAMKFHKGTDIAMPVGRDVPVARAGEVSFAGEQQGYGMTVVVDHGPGLSTRYAHLSEISVVPGEQLAEGQTLGKSGATGRVSGPHLHFEVLEEGRPVDPAVSMARLGRL